MESCCRTSICGQHIPGCPPWHSWIRAVRTMFVMAVLFLPAIPLMYALSVEDLEYQELQNKIEDLGLARTYNFFPGHTFGRIITGVLSFMYLFNIVILIFDGATDSNITKMYTTVLEISEKNAKMEDRIGRGQRFIKKAFSPIKRHGIIVLPIWLIVMLFLPLYFIVLFLLNAPLVKVLLNAFHRLFKRWSHVGDQTHSEEKVIKFCQLFWFCITMVFVFVVWTLGINFLIHVLALIVIKVLIDEAFVYQIALVLLLLIFYLRDTFKSVIAQYADHQHVIIDTLRKMEGEKLKMIAFNSSQKNENRIFQVDPVDEFPDNSNFHLEENRLSTASENFSNSRNELNEIHQESIIPIEEEEEENTNLFVVRFGRVKMRLKYVLLFLSKSDILHISKHFLFHTSTMDCIGAPGPLAENYIKASNYFLFNFKQ